MIELYDKFKFVETKKKMIFLNMQQTLSTWNPPD